MSHKTHTNCSTFIAYNSALNESVYPAIPQWLWLVLHFQAKHNIPQDRQPPYSPDLFLFFQLSNLTWREEDFKRMRQGNCSLQYKVKSTTTLFIENDGGQCVYLQKGAVSKGINYWRDVACRFLFIPVILILFDHIKYCIVMKYPLHKISFNFRRIGRINI